MLEFPGQCHSLWLRIPQRKQKVGSLSYLKETQNLSPSGLTMLSPLYNGLVMGRSTRTLMNFAYFDSQDRLSVSVYLPNLLPKSLPTSSDIFSKGSPQTWTQKGEWVKEIFVTDNPFLYLHKSKRLLSKFHGPFLSTHSIWYFELNLNWKIFFPTSTILKFKPNFQADLRVLFRALKFWFRYARRGPNKLNAHSSNSFDLLVVEIEMSSSSSFVCWRYCNPSITAWSIIVRCIVEIVG